MKTTANYQKIISILPSGFGQKKITVLYRGKEITGHYTQMPTVDLYKSGERGFKTAGNFIYDEIVRQNKKQRK